MSSKSKIKGYHYEVSVRDKLLAEGIPAERVIGSGMFGGKYTGDVVIPNIEHPEFVCECKKRKDGAGFVVLEKWMKDKDVMFLARDRQESMVVLSWTTYIKLMKKFYE